jgi:hypothetical protein
MKTNMPTTRQEACKLYECQLYCDKEKTEVDPRAPQDRRSRWAGQISGSQQILLTPLRWDEPCIIVFSQTQARYASFII